MGRDISITGFDDILLAEYATPGLTTAHQPAYEMGCMVGKAVTRPDPLDQLQILIEPTLTIRLSTGTPSSIAGPAV